VAHPFFDGLTAPLHIAHRGGAKLAPENTMVAFRAAVERWRTDVLELDVHATADGEVVVFHDPTLERCTDGAGALSALTFAQLSGLDAAFHHPAWRGQGVRVPRLTEVLEAFPGVKVNLEVKTDGALEPFVQLVRSRPAWRSRLCIGSEHDALAGRLVEALPDACHFFPANALAAFVMSARGGDAPEDDPRYLVLDMPLEWEGLRVFDELLAHAAKAAGKWVNVWTVDDPVDMRQIIAQGVGGVMTDRPDLLRAVLDER
jgi:glycerophosphoryl diester phosphodiesterase